MSLEVSVNKKFKGFHLDISFSSQNDCVGILGASGCGKSMTLRCVAGIMTPDSGRIVCNGRVLFDSEKKINLTPQQRNVGYLFQNYALFPRMTVRKNIGIGLRKMPPAEREAAVSEMIKRFHLEGLEDRYPGQLSGGQQQRVALARILVCRPDVLMLDEPFAAMDSFLKEQMHFELQKVLADYAGDVLFVTHSRDEVYRFCDRAVVMAEGAVADAGTVADLFYRPGKLVTAKLSGCKNFSSARKLGEHRLYAEDWGVELVSEEPVPDTVRYTGIRAHDFIPAETVPEDRTNVFVGQLLDVSEGPFEVSVRMKVNGVEPERDDQLVWWKLDTGEWENYRKEHFPPAFTVQPDKVLVLE